MHLLTEGQREYCVLGYYYNIAVDRSSFNTIDWEHVQRIKINKERVPVLWSAGCWMLSSLKITQ